MVSSLIYGENSNPLGLYAAATCYPVVHVASWPSHFDLDMDIHRINHMVTVSADYMLKVFLVNSVTWISDEYIARMSHNQQIRDFLTAEKTRKMGATVMNPFGEIIACGDGEPSKLLLCDEPTGALDRATGREVLDIFVELNAMGNTIIMITHDEKVAAYARRVVHIVDGKIAETVH